MNEKMVEAVALGRQGLSLREIHRRTGIDRDAVARVLREAGVAVRAARHRRLADVDATGGPASEPCAASVMVDAGEFSFPLDWRF